MRKDLTILFSLIVMGVMALGIFLYFLNPFHLSPEGSISQRREAYSQWRSTDEVLAVTGFLEAISRLEKDSGIADQDLLVMFFRREIELDGDFEEIRENYIMFDWSQEEWSGTWYMMIPHVRTGSEWPAVANNLQLIRFHGVSPNRLPPVMHVKPKCYVPNYP